MASALVSAQLGEVGGRVEMCVASPKGASTKRRYCSVRTSSRRETRRATNRNGQSYMVSVLTENPSAPIPATSALPILASAVKGAFALAAR